MFCMIFELCEVFILGGVRVHTKLGLTLLIIWIEPRLPPGENEKRTANDALLDYL